MIDSVGFAYTVPQINSDTPAIVKLTLAIHRVVRMASDTSTFLPLLSAVCVRPCIFARADVCLCRVYVWCVSVYTHE